MDKHTNIDDQKHPLTMRYNDFAFTSVSTRISLQRKAESLRPLFDFVRIPSLNNLLIPILRVGAVRSKRLLANYMRRLLTQDNKKHTLGQSKAHSRLPSAFHGPLVRGLSRWCGWECFVTCPEHVHSSFGHLRSPYNELSNRQVSTANSHRG